MAQAKASGQSGPARGGCARVLLVCLMTEVAAGAALAQAGYATQPFTPPNFHMPQGGGCAGEVARWQAIQDNDYASGNIALKVYDQIKGEIARAEAACGAGHDAEARAMVTASKRRHGYPG